MLVVAAFLQCFAAHDHIGPCHPPPFCSAGGMAAGAPAGPRQPNTPLDMDGESGRQSGPLPVRRTRPGTTATVATSGGGPGTRPVHTTRAGIPTMRSVGLSLSSQRRDPFPFLRGPGKVVPEPTEPRANPALAAKATIRDRCHSGARVCRGDASRHHATVDARCQRRGGSQLA